MKYPILSAILLLLCSLTALADIKDLPVIEIEGKLYHYYDVQPRETIYGLSHKLGISREEMIRWNPALVDGLRSGDRLLFPVTASESNAHASEPSNVVTHKVERGETVYGLSNRYGLTVDEFIDLNPTAADGLKAGEIVIISLPKEKPVTALAAPSSQLPPVNEPPVVVPVVPTPPVAQVVPQPVAEPEQEEAEDPDEDEEAAALANIGFVIDDEFEEPAPATLPVQPREASVNIAVMLPFMLSAETMDKPARRYTEFYKGMLVAVDSLKSIGAPIHIYAYDTAGSTDAVRDILNRPEMQQMQVIVGPDTEGGLAETAAWARQNGVTVFNAFAVKDTDYLNNPAMIQANIPPARMQERAIEALRRRYPQSHPVILKRKDATGDHADFVQALTQNYEARGVKPIVIEFADRLKAANLSVLDPAESYVFIPDFGKQPELNKVLPALVEYREALSPDRGDAFLFGYPEWITYRGTTLQNMQQMNTVVYSRFFNDAESLDTRDFEEAYKRWYGAPMENAVPRQGLMGFDAGMFLINALRANGGDFHARTPFYSGLQNGYRLRRDGLGLYNDVIYFINFRPSGMTVRELLD